MTWVKLTLFMVALLAILSIYSYLDNVQTHYIGKTPITVEQFVDITSQNASSISQFKRDNYISAINGEPA